MKTHLRRLLASLALTTAITTGTIAATAAPATTIQADTAWGTPPTDGTLPVTPPDAGVDITITPLDTAWG